MACRSRSNSPLPTSVTSNYAIRAKGLSKRFGMVEAVRDLDLNVPTGRIYGFLGPNGSGKSTTIRMLCGLLAPSAGSAEVLGEVVPGGADRLKARIGYMTQKFSLFTDLTIDENLRFMSEIYALAAEGRRRRIAEVIERYRLSPLRKQLAGTLSGGQKQRLALACAVLHKPELLLLDEPTSAVDPQNRRDFWASLFQLAENGTTILVSTHYMDEAERCHRLAILDHGEKVADGTPAELQANTGMQVVEVTATETWRAQEVLQALDETSSVTQLGARLRALVPVTRQQPQSLIQGALGAAGIEATTHIARPSLEDVFVAATLRH